MYSGRNSKTDGLSKAKQTCLISLTKQVDWSEWSDSYEEIHKVASEIPYNW